MVFDSKFIVGKVLNKIGGKENEEQSKFDFKTHREGCF